VDARFGAVKGPLVAWIDEDRCIGCARCLPACPVDAIVGAARYTHTVIAAQCTGCELCLPPCPVDCIELRPAVAESVTLRHADRAA
jgi:electron transport complex protein RnfB